MNEEYPAQSAFSDIGARLRDLEDRQQLLKDRILLIGKSLIEEREKSSDEIRELKKSHMLIKEENLRMKELLSHVAEQLDVSARKEELMILQRQFDLFRKQ